MITVPLVAVKSGGVLYHLAAQDAKRTLCDLPIGRPPRRANPNELLPRQICASCRRERDRGC